MCVLLYRRLNKTFHEHYCDCVSLWTVTMSLHEHEAVDNIQHLQSEQRVFEVISEFLHCYKNHKSIAFIFECYLSVVWIVFLQFLNSYTVVCSAKSLWKQLFKNYWFKIHQEVIIYRLYIYTVAYFLEGPQNS